MSSLFETCSEKLSLMAFSRNPIIAALMESKKMIFYTNVI